MLIVLTRAKEDCGELRAMLSREAIDFPCIEFAEPSDNYASLDKALKSNHEYDWIFFLSKRAADIFFKRLIEIGGNLFNLAPHLKIAAIGDSSKEFIEKTIGFPVNFSPSIFNSETLVKEFLEDCKSPRPLRILIPRVESADESEFKKLEALGHIVEIPESYKSKCPDKKSTETQNLIKELEEKIVKESKSTQKPRIIFTSSQIVRNFKDLISESKIDPGKLLMLSIGPKTSKTIQELFPNAELLEAPRASLSELVII